MDIITRFLQYLRCTTRGTKPKRTTSRRNRRTRRRARMMIGGYNWRAAAQKTVRRKT